MDVINFDKKADEVRYGPMTLIEDVSKVHEIEGIETMAVIYKKKNGQVGFGCTSGNNAEMVGLIEMAKFLFISDCIEE